MVVNNVFDDVAISLGFVYTSLSFSGGVCKYCLEGWKRKTKENNDDR